MTLSERIAYRFCEDGPEQDGHCTVHAGGAFDGNGNQCDRAHQFHKEPSRPEWRRRMEERLAKNGRVAEKALDR